MDRLTHKHEGGEIELLCCLITCTPDGEPIRKPQECKKPTSCLGEQQANEKLAAYEDSNLTPERVAELARAEAEGRLVALPVRIKDIVYMLHDDEVKPMQVEHFRWDGLEICFSAECLDQSEDCDCGEGSCCMVRFSASTMNGRIYTKRDEAERALAERTQQDGQR